MRILHLATSMNGGAGIAARRIAESQYQNGLNVQLWSGNGENIVLSPFEKIMDVTYKKRIKSKSLTFVQSRILQRSDHLVTPISIDTLSLADIEQTDFDLINLHAGYNFVTLRNLRMRLPNTPVVVTMHDQRTFTGGCHYSISCREFERKCDRCPQMKLAFSGLTSAILRKELKYQINDSGIFFVSPSKWLADEARMSSLLADRNIAVIRNPIPEIFEFQDLKRFPNQDEELKIAFISENLGNPYKGIHVFLEALSKLPKGKKFKVKFIGKGSIKLNIPNVSISQRHCATSFEIIDEIRGCDVVVVPSVEDNSPSVISESLMCGIPVIGSRTGGISEILKEFKLPIFQNGNSTELAKLIANFEPVNGIELSQQARKIFSYTVIAGSYQSYYEQILQN